MAEIKVIKKDGKVVDFDAVKIKEAITKSAERANVKLNEDDKIYVAKKVKISLEKANKLTVTVLELHRLVMDTLAEVSDKAAESYRSYRNYKENFVDMMDEVLRKYHNTRYFGDRSNANADSSLVSTQRSILCGEIAKEIYKKFYLSPDELEAINDGYIYIHDLTHRLTGAFNCFRRDTRFITEYGIKSFYDFSDGDEVMVLTHKGRWRKAKVRNYGWQKLQKVTFKTGGTGKGHTVYCTKNHRWILNDKSITTELGVGDKLFQIEDMTIFDWDNLSLKNKKIWCNGFAKGDGAVRAGKVSDYVLIRLCGDKIKYSNRFKSCGYKVTDVLGSSDKYVYMFDLVNKEIPHLQLNYTNIKYYTNGLMCADGNRRDKNASAEFRGIQVTGDLNNHINDYLNMSGYFVTSKKDLTGEKTNYGVRESNTVSYYLSSSQKNRPWRVSSIESYNLNPGASVWCLEVEEDNSFVLEFGIATGNCCVSDAAAIMTGGFEMGNVWYNEPKTISSACAVLGDVIMSASSNHYGGHTVKVDDVLAPYCEKSFDMYIKEYMNITLDIHAEDIDLEAKAKEYAKYKTIKDLEQGLQGLEYKLNTLVSARGDFLFTTFAFGDNFTEWGQQVTRSILKVRKEGQGKPGHTRPSVFPKLTMLYRHEWYGEGAPYEFIFDEAIDCSSKAMYPDYTSLEPTSSIGETYEKWGAPTCSMGCRSYTSPWFKEGGMYPKDENDQVVLLGRANVGRR